MEEKEYLQTLGEQILNPHARPMCWKKFSEHIDEQMHGLYTCRNVSGRQKSCLADRYHAVISKNKPIIILYPCSFGGS